MKKTILSIIAIIGFTLALAPSTFAASGFQAGRIIDDSIFTDKSTMSVSQIQNFLNNKVTSCDTNGTQRSEMNNSGVPDYNKDGTIQRHEWGKYHYNQTTFPCLKNYKVNNVSAAQLIYDASQKYSINPQVMIVLLQKEQGLITDTWPLNVQYRSATGYGCPDTAACDSDYYGLKNQLDWAATMFRAILNDSPTWYTPYELGNNYIQYNPNASCGGSTVNILNRSTQALYNYTPYQPSQAALDAGWGTVNCGAYGNRNFYLYFTDWFGSTTSKPSYKWSPVSQALYLDAERTIRLPYGATLEPGQTVYASVKAKNTGNQTWYPTSMRLATSHKRDRTSLFKGVDWISNNRVTTIVESKVSPGEIATFEAEFTAPTKTGSYKEYFSLVIERAAWLNDPGLYFPINVQPARDFALYSDSTKTRRVNNSNISMYTGSKLYATVKVRNNTNEILPSKTKLATTNPNDRTSVFFDNSWLSANRIATLSQPLNIGETGTFEFTLTAPQDLNTYSESFGLVIDGTGGKWIETDTATINATVNERPSDRLAAGQQLSAGQIILSPDDRYRLSMQSDGNLVLYSPTRAIWASNTARSGATRVIMQDDGNLVLYSPTRAVWASNTARKDSNRLVMQTDGNLVLYSPTRAVWASNTAGR